MFIDQGHKCDQGNGTYLNPVLNGDYPDPSILRVGEDYYLACSSFVYYPSLTLYHSKDMVNWEWFSNPIQGFDEDVWAPDLIQHEGRFYLYFYTGSGNNWVSYADCIEGPWCAPINLHIPCIDPGHCVDEDGNRYLYLSGGNFVQLDATGTKAVSKVEQRIQEWPVPDEWDIEGVFMEGPKIKKVGDYYYLTTAEGGTAGPATGHMIVQARSKSVKGPWEFSPYNPILRAQSRNEKWICKGHGTLIDDVKGNWYIIYHAYENGYMTFGRQTLLEPLELTADGWFKTPDGVRADLPLKKPAGEAVQSRASLSVDFRNGEMPHHFRGFGGYDVSRFTFGPDGLTIQGKGTQGSNSNPLVFISGDKRYELTTCITLHGDCGAGITFLYNQEQSAGFDFHPGGVDVIRHSRPLSGVRVEGEKLYFKVENDDQYIRTFYSTDGVHYKKINHVVDVSTYHHNTCDGFLSLRPGIFAYGEGSATFEYLHYRVLD